MTNAAKPTAGFWKVGGKAGYPGHRIADNTGRSVCAIPSNGSRPCNERDANARLLAAAPEMLAALRAMLNGDEGARTAAALAVAHATGEEVDELSGLHFEPESDPDAWKRADDALIAAKRQRAA